MRYSASEKFEIIELVEQSTLSVGRTLAPIGIPRSTFYDGITDTRKTGSRPWRTASQATYSHEPTPSRSCIHTGATSES